MAHHATTTITPFSDNPDFDFEIRNILGQAVGGAADPGEVLAATAGIRKNDHAGWFYAWQQLGQRTAEAAQACAAAGHRVSAAGAFLRASAYFGVAVNAASSLKDSAELTPTFREQRDAWESFVANTPANVRRVDIPYESSSMPGWLFRPVHAGPAPTLVVVNGSDGALAGLWASTGCRCAGARLQRAPLRRTRPAVAALRARRALPSGLGARAHACLRLPRRARRRRRGPHRGLRHQPGRVLGRTGHRVRAPLRRRDHRPRSRRRLRILDVSAAEKPHEAARQRAEREVRQGDGLRYEVLTRDRTHLAVPCPPVRRRRLRRDRQRGPRLQRGRRRRAHHDTPAHHQPGGRAVLARAGRGARIPHPGRLHHVRFTAAEGAGEHCQPLARTLTAQRMFDWLDDRIGSSSTTDR